MEQETTQSQISTEAARSTSQPKGFLEKMKQKWGLTSLFQVVLILIVFALTGFSALALKGVIYDLLGFDNLTSGWLKTICYLVVVFPLYQILLLAYGFLFGQFNFFWEKEKKLIRAIKKLFVRSS
ncbi:MAG: DUF6787 family protein [Cyclobacteriaceae bacterium]